MIHLLKTGYSVKRSGNFIFVCGGNAADDMRTKFRDFCEKNKPEYEIFLPEFAMKNYFSDEMIEPFNIADFESVVSELSRAIVLFPEAPGSFAEVGYFSAIPEIASKVILAIDSSHQKKDSFISLGPASIIGINSLYRPNILIEYKKPSFDDIVERIDRIEAPKTRKLLEISEFKETSSYDLMSIISQIVSMLSIATTRDIFFLMRGLYGGHISEERIKRLISILIGSNHLSSIGDFGHYYLNFDRNLLGIRSGSANQENRIRLELAAIYQSSDPEFLGLVEDSRDVN